MLDALQLIGATVVPLNVIVLVPCVDPKFTPLIATGVPTPPASGARFVITGAMLKLAPLLGNPATVTTTLPVVAPAGTGTTMVVALQLVGVAAVPLKVTVLVPTAAPKFAPEIVTGVPTGPDAGARFVMRGPTVNATPLLARPPTVTTTLPVVAPVGTGTAMVVALQLVGVAAVPLNVTVLVPTVAPKFAPVIVTAAPTAPESGARLVMRGATVKFTPLLA
jgi:hypothetical protein